MLVTEISRVGSWHLVTIFRELGVTQNPRLRIDLQEAKLVRIAATAPLNLDRPREQLRWAF